MEREELLEFHKFLVYLSKFLIDCGLPKYFFDEYKELGCRPQDIHRTNEDHRQAIMILAIALSKVLSENMDVLSESFVLKMKTLRVF
jgi:hypothetical protein